VQVAVRPALHPDIRRALDAGPARRPARVVLLVARGAGVGLAALVVLLLTVVGGILFTPAPAVPVPVPAATTGNSDRTPLAARYAANRRTMLAHGAPYAAWATADRQFLLFDPRGTGLVAEVFGDLSTADRIAVLVPGVDTRGPNFLTGLGGVPARAPAVQAENLYDATFPAAGPPIGTTAGTAAGAGARVAVVAWLGYRTPHGVGRDAAREELARAGAVALERFVGGLVRRRPAATLTLIGHSYGSVVVGLAAPRLPRQVTDLVATGSPGMGVDRAADLRTRARVWAALAPADWIHWVPGIELFGVGHGTQPADPAFGARPFGTAGVTDHDHYLAPGTRSLADVADIVLGRDAAVTR
jgi:hypothetical protein